MKMEKIAMIHTVPGAAEKFEKLVREKIGDVKIIHTEDGAAREVLLRNGGLCPAVYKRILEDIMLSEEAGAELIFLTCSSISPCADLAPSFTGVPVLKVDEPMIRMAVRMGKRIVIAATAATTLEPTENTLRHIAEDMKKDISVTRLLCEEAYPFLISGDLDRYYGTVATALDEVMDSCDVIILAQASMEGVLNVIKEDARKVPILTSPEMGVENLKKYMLDE